MKSFPKNPIARTPAQTDTGHESLFLSIQGDKSFFKAAIDGEYLAGGLSWKHPVGRHVVGLAVKAREACGTNRPWSDVQELAAHASRRIQSIADEIVERWYDGNIPEHGMSPSKLIDMHGPADLLAYGVLWSQKDQSEMVSFDPLVGPNNRRLGTAIIAAFSLLMIDNAVAELATGNPITACDFLAIAGTGLAYASMDEAQFSRQLEQFNRVSENAKIGARAKWSDRDEQMAFALNLAPAINSNSRAEVARQLADAIFNKFTKRWSDETVDGWLKDSNWKPSPNTGVNGTESDPGSMPA
jgi:hypothetical protein